MSLKDTIYSNVEKFEAVLPEGSPANLSARIITSFLKEVAENPKVRSCSQASLLSSLNNLCSVGLEVGGAASHAHLVPYGKDCRMMIGYRGLEECGIRGGSINRVIPRLYYTGEVEAGNVEISTVNGLDVINHKQLLGGEGERGSVAGCYALYWTPDGGVFHEHMPISELEEYRRNLRSGNSPVWKMWTGEMYKKTVVRRASKKWRMTQALARAIELDNEFENSHETPISTTSNAGGKKKLLAALDDVLQVSS